MALLDEGWERRERKETDIGASCMIVASRNREFIPSCYFFVFAHMICCSLSLLPQSDFDMMPLPRRFRGR